ncbi:hypothetical protein CLOP_g1136 [Closterium sp. NIES-67]|nr:hypothetical protein CLOP_g1136 [Closterium sp. NIES-67]
MGRNGHRLRQERSAVSGQYSAPQCNFIPQNHALWHQLQQLQAMGDFEACKEPSLSEREGTSVSQEQASWGQLQEVQEAQEVQQVPQVPQVQEFAANRRDEAPGCKNQGLWDKLHEQRRASQESQEQRDLQMLPEPQGLQQWRESHESQESQEQGGLQMLSEPHKMEISEASQEFSSSKKEEPSVSQSQVSWTDLQDLQNQQDQQDLQDLQVLCELQAMEDVEASKELTSSKRNETHSSQSQASSDQLQNPQHLKQVQDLQNLDLQDVEQLLVLQDLQAAQHLTDGKSLCGKAAAGVEASAEASTGENSSPELVIGLAEDGSIAVVAKGVDKRRRLGQTEDEARLGAAGHEAHPGAAGNQMLSAPETSAPAEAAEGAWPPYAEAAEGSGSPAAESATAALAAAVVAPAPTSRVDRLSTSCRSGNTTSTSMVATGYRGGCQGATMELVYQQHYFVTCSSVTI